MDRGISKTLSTAALLAATGLLLSGAGSASAADLGGNCCTDLEERVAELEATTARKGNRKVSLQVYGTIAYQIMFWDDGAERNAYVLNNQTATTLLGFQGNAKINADWSAGYKLEWEINYSPNGSANQLVGGDQGGTATGAPTSLRHAALWMKHEHYGTVWLGHSSTATSLITDINLAEDAANIARSITFSNGPAFFVRRSGTVGNGGLSALTNRVAFGNQTHYASGGYVRRNGVRWISPNFLGQTKSSGFNLQVGWWEDDLWDIALRYVETFGDFRFAAGVGYGWAGDTDINCANVSLNAGLGLGTALGSGVDCENIAGSASLMHVPTGIYVTGAFDFIDDNNRDRIFGRNVDNTDSRWYLQAGIQRKWFPLGNTTIYGEYGEADAGANVSAGARTTVAATDVLNSVAGAADIIRSDGRFWGVGVVQAIDNAAMAVYLAYKNVETDFTLQNRANLDVGKANPTDNWQAVIVGATIRF